jgi:protocatechuate 3,4-dioxygenase beta subunit
VDERIEGRVVGGAGQPVAEATVVVLHGPGAVPDIAAVSDAQGRFSFGGIPSGAYRLRATAPDGTIGEAAADVPGPECVIALAQGVPV